MGARKAMVIIINDDDEEREGDEDGREEEKEIINERQQLHPNPEKKTLDKKTTAQPRKKICCFASHLVFHRL